MKALSHTHAIERIFCKFCGTKLSLVRCDPSLTPGYDRLSYQCSKCRHALLKERPSQRAIA